MCVKKQPCEQTVYERPAGPGDIAWQMTTVKEDNPKFAGDLIYANNQVPQMQMVHDLF